MGVDNESLFRPAERDLQQLRGEVSNFSIAAQIRQPQIDKMILYSMEFMPTTSKLSIQIHCLDQKYDLDFTASI